MYKIAWWTPRYSSLVSSVITQPVLFHLCSSLLAPTNTHWNVEASGRRCTVSNPGLIPVKRLIFVSFLKLSLASFFQLFVIPPSSAHRSCPLAASFLPFFPSHETTSMPYSGSSCNTPVPFPEHRVWNNRCLKFSWLMPPCPFESSSS